jgi:aspartate aminotransferase
VITHAPYWPTIVDQIKLADAKPVIVQTHREDGFAIKAAAIIEAMTPRTRAVIINSPCNPTGALISEADMTEIADAAAARGIWVIADITYEQLIYDPVPHNLAKILLDRMPDRTVLCSSASKSYAMTGWRCGWTIGPKAMIAQCNIVQGHATSNINSITQKAGIAALTGPQDGVTVMLNEYRKRRDAVHGWLTADPRFVCVKPSGAFYLFPYVADLLSPTGIKTTGELAEALLQEVSVAVTPGEGFDAPGFFRLSYATSLDRLREGVDRMFAFVATLEKSGKIPTATHR